VKNSTVVGPASAHADKQRVLPTIEALLDMRFPSNVHITPDGRRVAFEVWERTSEQKARSRIWTVDTGGGEAQPLTHGKKSDTSPRWSPDGKRLAFLATGEGEKDKPQLHIMAADGGETQQICALPNGASDLAWAPDGSRIAFISLAGDEPGDDPKVFTPDKGRHHRLWTVRPDYDIPELVTPDGITVWEFSWSPDSKQLALYYARGVETTDWYHSQIGVVAASGGAVRQLTQFAPVSRQASALAWSPDGKQLAYVSGSWSDPGRGGGDIFALDVASGESRNLTPGVAISATWCAWFPDGRRLLYTAVDEVNHQVGILDIADGSLTALDRTFVMQWDQPTLSPTPDRRSFATVHSTATQPNDVYLGTLADGAASIEWKRLSRLNPIAEETFVQIPSEHIRYASVDGVLIDALFTPAVNHKGDGLPPLYVNVHGGPSGAWCDEWDGLSYMYSAAGFAVLRVNYRGSWGRGVAFADGVLGDMGGKDFHDIMAGVDYLIAQGLIDGERLAIGGWSNGGYLSAWAVTQTNRFKSATMGAGISDWHNMHAQTNIADADILLLQANPLENSDAYRRASPITFASRVTTPTLILHGEDDPAVPVAQAYAFYRALCERNVPTELAVYPREGHGLQERDHVVNCFERELRWLEKYV
jgi:dipeptidyl aminopeptidase/acylaminoacyl peptidase